MNSVQFKTKDLLRFHSGYHGDQVFTLIAIEIVFTLATMSVADAYYLKEPLYIKYEFNMT